ncbi:hypothetical protein L873DRAFT_1663828 [Choiromyces venosus 120613-1]|uniref:AD domain-containing protein n=1 Tax=Choiromyces venosus 120613-1 TaxID=1336337 RepID=A0A3N4K728_9PEZI|nr:hypothetical protein L873DRAFT_1663828 [Choiromyces venosus 120613-1]
MDNRRQSTGGRGGGGGDRNNVSGNNANYIGGQGGNLAALDWVVGLRIRVVTIIDDTYEGTIYSYDPLTSTLALIQSPAHPPPTPVNENVNVAQSYSPQDYRILKISFLKEVTVLSAPKQRSVAQPFTNAEPKIGTVDIAAVAAREKDAARAEAERIANKGVGVTKEAQDIYDALARTMKCRWHDKQIIVYNDVIIDEPYTVDRVRSGDQNALIHVKKVLEGERRKLETQRRAATPTSGERKGG